MNPAAFRFLALILAALALATQFGNGCVSDGGGDDGYNDRPGSGGGWGGGGTEIPGRADIVAEGRGTLRYRAPEDGRVWLFDADRRFVIDDRRLNPGREYIVSPSDGKVWIDNDRVRTYSFERGHEIRIYYLADRGSGGSGGGNRPPPLPPELDDASRVAFGRGDLSYVARDRGRVWVYDATDGRVVYRGDLLRNDRILVSPERNYISLREAESRGSFRMNPRHDHAIYFKRVSGGSDGGAVGPFPEGAGGTVPKSAIIAREGRGSDLSFAADGPGTVYLYDVNAKRVLHTYRLKKGQRYTVSPAKGESAVDGNTVHRDKLSTRTTYRLYFNLDV